MKKVVTWLGRALMVAALVFILRELWTNRASLKYAMNSMNITLYFASALVWGLAIYFVFPRPFMRLVNLFSGNEIPFTKIAYNYCRSNLYKYLPGNVMHYVGRNKLAVDENISHKSVAFASMAEVALTCVSAVLVISIFSFGDAKAWVKQNVHLTAAVWTSVAILSCFGVAVVVFRKRIISFFGMFALLCSKKGVLILVHSLVIWCVSLIMNSLIFLIVLKTLGVNIPIRSWPVAIGLGSLAWVLGFITPGAPGGLGIREAVLTYFFASYLPTDVVVIGAVVFRVITIGGDVLAYLFSAIQKANCNKKTSTA